MERISKAAVDTLDQQHGPHRRARDGGDGGTEREDEWRQDDRGDHAQLAHQRAPQKELHHERRRIEQQIEARDERPDLVGGQRVGHLSLEEVVHGEHRRGGQNDDERDLPEQWISMERPEDPAGVGPLFARLRPGHVARHAHASERQPGAHEQRSGQEEERLHRDEEERSRRGPGAEDAPDDARGGDEPEESAPLCNVEELSRERPELRDEDRGEDAAPDVESNRCHAPRRHRIHRRRHQSANGEAAGERPPHPEARVGA